LVGQKIQKLSGLFFFVPRAMQEANSNQELLIAWRQGDEHAAELLVRRYMVRLTALARSRLSRKLARRLDAEDAVLSAWRSFFVAAGDGRVSVPEDDNLWPLLVTLTLRKLARQAARHTAQRRGVQAEQNVDREDSWQTVLSREPSPDEAALVADELESLMASLERTDREILSRRLQGQSVAAIAAAMDVTERTIRRNLQRICELFRSLHGETDEPFLSFPKDGAARDPRAPLQGRAAPAVVTSRTALTPTIEYHDLRLQKLIGQGGFGKVYRALRISDGTMVAAKFLKKRFWRDLRCVQCLLDETTRVSALSHRNIIRHFGWGISPAGVPFIVMEWVDGTDAERWRRTCHPSLRDVIECCIAVADALTAAHAVGIIHGDVTPANVLRRTDGRSLLSDFGFAQSLQDSQRAHFGGTLGFLSPEQISDAFGSVGQWTDVYGLGGLMYALMTESPPFTGRDLPEVLASIVSGRPPVPPDRLASEIPEDLNRLVLACLGKEPAERPASTADVRASLQLIENRIPR
jgi:RNA polymerase sigma factor (sigma-70 family)